ncbi:MAG: Eco57I restriction-modification methylase domain-containing protein, partial [Athalassotoga sp.]|uniref:Eco57I restriction-modification methylase domain-containing protein n=1 Tax=Athalassotoga sp. TaxID=2022597 RepID=UPI003D073D1C
FYEKGIKLLKPGGHLCFITSNKWMRAGYGEKLREFFIKHNPKILIDLGPGVFESATVDTNILLIQKKENQNKLIAATLQKEDKKNILNAIDKKGILLEKLSKDAWFIGSSAEQRLKEKIERLGKPLKEWDVNIYRGILTGLNEAFIITTEKKDEILANCKTEEERERTSKIIKPILRGRDIKRYYYEWAGLWVLWIYQGINIEKYP